MQKRIQAIMKKLITAWKKLPARHQIQKKQPLEAQTKVQGHGAVSCGLCDSGINSARGLAVSDNVEPVLKVSLYEETDRRHAARISANMDAILVRT